MYLTSPGCPTEIGLQLGKAYYSLQKVRVEGVFFISSLYFRLFSSFSPVPLFHLLYHLSSPFLWETTQNDQQGLTCRLNPNTIKIK